MKNKECMERAEHVVLHTYNRYPVVLDHGEGVYLYDLEGKEYLDFGAGIAVNALGYSNQEHKDAIHEQVDKLLQTSNLFYNEPAMEAGEKLLKVTGLDKVFFTNSGAEAMEGAIKAARKYAYIKDGTTEHEIIAMNHSFHGRTMGALAVTGNPHYREAFEPLIGGVRFADYNDYESVLNQVNDKTCAIILETVQGEGGIYPAESEFLQKLRTLCDERDILLILDEIQCGMGRSGYMYAWQAYDVKPDIMTTAKALGCGVPIGAFLLNEKVAQASLTAGDHGTTYGGNPLVCAAASKVFDIFEKEHILEHVRAITPYMEKTLDAIVADYDFLEARRGMGLMQGIVVRGDYKPITIINQALENGLVLMSAGSDVLRFVPPLVITEADIDEMDRRLRRSLDRIQG